VRLGDALEKPLGEEVAEFNGSDANAYNQNDLDDCVDWYAARAQLCFQVKVPDFEQRPAGEDHQANNDDEACRATLSAVDRRRQRGFPGEPFSHAPDPRNRDNQHERNSQRATSAQKKRGLGQGWEIKGDRHGAFSQAGSFAASFRPAAPGRYTARIDAG
jgi:hypothetical protein